MAEISVLQIEGNPKIGQTIESFVVSGRQGNGNTFQ